MLQAPTCSGPDTCGMQTRSVGSVLAGRVLHGAAHVRRRQRIHVHTRVQRAEVGEERAEVVVRVRHVVHRAHLADGVHSQLRAAAVREGALQLGSCT